MKRLGSAVQNGAPFSQQLARIRIFCVIALTIPYSGITSMVFGQQLSPTPSDGDRILTIDTTGAAALAGETVAVFNIASGAVCPLPAGAAALAIAPGSGTTILPGGTTSIILSAPLAQGTHLCVTLTSTAGAVSTILATVQPPASPPGFDWGLVRAYFTLGALTSQERDQFSHEDLFLSFHLDKTYVQLGNLNNTGRHSYHPGLHTFFETRLTAIPVAVQTCTGSSSTCANSNSSTNNAGSSATTTTADAFLNTQKSARLQFGALLPFMLNRWSVSGRTASGATTTKDYSLYFAPLVKTGFDTTLNGLNQTQQQSGTPSQVQAIGNSSQFYKFYDFGFRLGHYELTGDKSIAPSELSYVDVAWGRFSNLASLLCPANQYLGNNSCGPAPGSSTAPVLPWQRDYRLNVEGLLEVPATHGFSVGFSTNVSFYRQGHPNGQNVPIHIQPPDDLRFLFAYKFDISKIAAKLAPQF